MRISPRGNSVTVLVFLRKERDPKDYIVIDLL